MSTIFTSITILLVFILRSILSEDPSIPCTLEVIGLQEDGAVFEFDRSEMDRILDRVNWGGPGGEVFSLYLVRGDDRRSVRVQRTFISSMETGRGRGQIEPMGDNMKMAGDWQIGDEFAIVNQVLNCQPSDDEECAQFTCDSVDGPRDVVVNGQRRILDRGPYTGFQCNFDTNKVDTILDTERWGAMGAADLEGIFPIYNHRTMTMKYARLHRYPNGGSEPEMNRGYLDLGRLAAAGDWEEDDKLSFIGTLTSTICDPDCENDYPLFDTFLDECSVYAMDRLSTTAELERLNRRTNLNTLGLFALGLKTKILLRKLSFCCGGGSSDSSDSLDSWDSSNPGKTGHGGSKLLSTSENLNIINAYLEMIADEISLDGLGELGKLLNSIQQEMEMND